MKTISSIKPEKFKLEKCGDKGIITFFENVVQNEDGFFEYDEWHHEIAWRSGLEASVEKYYSEWLAMAKLERVMEYSEIQLIQQEITDLQLENIEQGQIITDLELMILEGMNNV